MEHFKKNSKVIYLEVPYKEIEKRVGSLHKRGVVSNGRKTIEEIFTDRVKLYEKYSDIVIREDDKSIREIVQDICAALMIAE